MTSKDRNLANQPNRWSHETQRKQLGRTDGLNHLFDAFGSVSWGCPGRCSVTIGWPVMSLEAGGVSTRWVVGCTLIGWCIHKEAIRGPSKDHPGTIRGQSGVHPGDPKKEKGRLPPRFGPLGLRIRPAGFLSMPDRFPVLNVNSDNQTDEYLSFLVYVKTKHFILDIENDFEHGETVRHT